MTNLNDNTYIISIASRKYIDTISEVYYNTVMSTNLGVPNVTNEKPIMDSYELFDHNGKKIIGVSYTKEDKCRFKIHLQLLGITKENIKRITSLHPEMPNIRTYRKKMYRIELSKK